MFGRMLIALTYLTIVWLGSSLEEALPAPIFSSLESTINGVKIKVEQPARDGDILFNFLGVNRNGRTIFLQGPSESNELLLNRCSIRYVGVSYTENGKNSPITTIDLDEASSNNFKPKAPTQRMVDGKIQLTDFHISDRLDGLNYFYIYWDIPRKVPNNGIIEVGCNVDKVFIYTEDDCKRRSQNRQVNLDLRQSIKNFVPNEPILKFVDDAVRLTNFQVKDWPNELTYFYIPYDRKKDGQLSIKVPDNNIIEVECGVDVVIIFARDGCRSQSANTYVEINWEQAKPKPPGYIQEGLRVTLNPGRNGLSMKGYVIEQNDREHHVVGLTYVFNLKGKNQRAIVRSVGACDLESDAITIKYASLPAPILNPVENTVDGAKITVKQPPENNGTLFEFRTVLRNGLVLWFQGPSESNEVLLTGCAIQKVIVSYNKHGERSSDTIIDLDMVIYNNYKPKHPTQRMYDGMILLENFQMETGNKGLKYFYTVDRIHGIREVFDNRFIKVGCNVAGVNIYAQTKCNRKSQNRRVELDLNQCPHAPIIRISGKTIGNLKITARTHQRDDSVRFNFIGFDKYQGIVFDHRSRESNEIIVTGCDTRSVIVWYDYHDVASSSAIEYLHNYTIENFAPKQPKQQIVGDKIRLTNFHLENWPNELDYFYLPYTNYEMIHGGDLYAVPDNNIIEVGCGVKVVRIFARDQCLSVSNFLNVYVKC